MMRIFTCVDGRLAELPREAGEPLPLDRAVWFDLLNPTREEETELEAALAIAVPTRDDMDEIEASSRFYTEGGAAYMTASILARPGLAKWEHEMGGRFMALPVSFVLTGGALVTVRYHDPRAFHILQTRAAKGDIATGSAKGVLAGLFEVIIDRLADIAEEATTGLDTIAARLFDTGIARPAKGAALDHVLEMIGFAEDLNGKLAASLATLERLVTAMSSLAQDTNGKHKGGIQPRLKTMARDLHSLSEVVERQAMRITFLLDSTLGKINIEQNGIIKIFSVMSVIFLPPTLIASIYGMNFEFMPELSHHWAYPAVLFLMLLSAVLPYLYFRRKGWL